MRWDDLRESTNVEDVRASTGGAGLKLGVGGTLLALIVSYFLGIDPRLILGLASSVPSQQAAPAAHYGTPQDEQGRFFAAVLGETEDTWSAIFESQGLQYVAPKLVLYRESIPTACGRGSSAAGPFYCPLDRKVYLDLSFFEQLADEFQAPGQFAEAYVLAHEVGHHVQALLGIEKKVSDAQSTMSELDANRLNVRLELQADCLAGIWASALGQLPGITLEPGDIEQGLRATHALGDDMLQKQETGTVVLDSFTHGSGDQRTRWFKRGLETAKIEQCNTFAASEL